MKQSAEPKGRPSANGAGNPHAAIDCLLTNVTRTNPQVALGSSFSKVTISSAVSSSVKGVTFGTFCDLAASDGNNVAALTTAVPCRARRRRLQHQSDRTRARAGQPQGEALRELGSPQQLEAPRGAPACQTATSRL